MITLLVHEIQAVILQSYLGVYPFELIGAYFSKDVLMGEGSDFQFP